MPDRIMFLFLVLGILLGSPAATADAPAAGRIQELIAEDRLEQALALTESELEKDDGAANYRFLQGLVLARMNRLDDAAAVFSRLTEEHPELPEPYNNLAVIHAARGDFEAARKALQKAINTHPSYATAHENMGDIYAKMASQAYNHALQLDDGNETARAKLALIDDLFSMPATAPAAEAVAASSTAPAREGPGPVAAAPATEPEPAASAAPEAVAPIASPAPAPQPAPRPQAAAAPRQVEPGPPPPVDQGAAIRHVLDLWATAWSSQDVSAYLSYYAGDFTPDGNQSLGDWRRERRDRVGSPSFIRLTLSNVQVVMHGADHAQATFSQQYESDTYSDRVQKVLLLKKEGNDWRITQESVR